MELESAWLGWRGEMFHRVMVAIDGSEISNRAFAHALALAREAGADLRIIHVVDLSVVRGGGEGVNFEAFYGSLRQTGERLLSEATAQAVAAGVNPEVSLAETETKRVSEVIVEEAAKWSADLIVIGTHGRRGFSRLFLGSVAEGVTRTSPLPVLLIRGE